MGKYDHLSREALISLLEQSESKEAKQLQDRLDGEKRIAQALMLMLKKYNGNYEEDIMRIVLERYQADRAFLFKFDWEKNTNSNLYEVNSEGIPAEIQNLQDLPNEALAEHLEKFRQGIPLIVNNVDQMKVNSYRGPRQLKQVFQQLNLKSAILFPMHIFGELWGFVGMETVKNERIWSEDDIEWLKAFTDVLSIGVSQRFTMAKADNNERRFTELFQNIPVGYIRHRIICNEDHQPIDYEILEINPAFERLTGIKKQQCVGKKASQINNSLKFELLKNYSEVAFSGKQVQFDYFAPLFNKWFYSVLYSPQYGEFISLFYDITDRVTATEKIRLNEEKLRIIFESLPVGIISFDSERHFENCNELATHLFKELVNEEGNKDLHLSESQYRELEEKQELSIDFIYDIEHSQTLALTDHIPEGALYLNIRIVKYFNKQGACQGYLLIAVDNTNIKQINLELRNTEKELTENLVRLSLILESGKIYPWYMDLESGMLDISEEFYKVFGEDKASRKNYNLQDFVAKIHPDDLEIFQEKFQELQNGPSQRIKMDLRLNIFDKGYLWCEVSAAVQTRGKDSRITKWLGFLTIIQKRKDNEHKLIEALKKAEESDKLKSSFLANVSHEIRTPLNAIVGFSELIANSENEEDKNYYLDIVKTNNNLLLHLINDILDLSKIESGRIDLKESLVNLKELCRELCHVHQLRTKPGVKIIFDEDSSSLFLYSDRNRLTQIYSNLINNAIKNTDKGSITIGYLNQEQNVVFFVRDTGHGIPKDKQAVIFNRFEKLNSNIQGFGLGLSICKSLLEKMQGSISVTSEEGKGTEFRFTLPYRTPRQQPAEIETVPGNREAGQAPTSTEAQNVYTLLIAEDIDCNDELLKLKLDGKYKLIYARTGIEAISLFSNEHPSLILMDMRMPELDGVEAAQIIREVSPEIPIIALTAFASDSDKAEALAAGCNDFLTKPIDIEELKKKIGKLLNIPNP